LYLNTMPHFETAMAMLVYLDAAAATLARTKSAQGGEDAVGATGQGRALHYTLPRGATAAQSPWKVYLWTHHKHAFNTHFGRNAYMRKVATPYLCWDYLPGVDSDTGALRMPDAVAGVRNVAARLTERGRLPALDALFVLTLYTGDTAESIKSSDNPAYRAYLEAGVPVVMLSHRGDQLASSTAERPRRAGGASPVRVLHVAPQAAVMGLPVFLPARLLQQPLRFHANAPTPRWRFVVQGNFENERRSYPALLEVLHHPAVAALRSRFEVVIIGGRGRPPAALMDVPGVTVRVQLSESEFHAECRRAHFVLPLTKPRHQPRYYVDTFSSSIHVGLAYYLGFVTHSALALEYALPPAVVWAYDSLRAVHAAELPLAQARPVRGHDELPGAGRRIGLEAQAAATTDGLQLAAARTASVDGGRRLLRQLASRAGLEAARETEESASAGRLGVHAAAVGAAQRGDSPAAGRLLMSAGRRTMSTAKQAGSDSERNGGPAPLSSGGDDDDGVANQMAGVADALGIWGPQAREPRAIRHASHGTLLDAFLAAVATTPAQFAAARAAY
jgi:hypothetical protein